MTPDNSQSTPSKRKPFKWTQVQEKQGIISDASMGLSQAKIAEKWGVSRATVARVLKEFKEVCPQAELSKDLSHYREKLKGKAITAVENGLDCPDDPYKQGNLGVQVLKGLGEFNGDTPSNPINVLIANMPPSLYAEAIKAGAITFMDEPEITGMKTNPTPLPPSDETESA